MNDEVVPLRRQPTIVELLQALLARAESGEITGIAVATTLAGHDIGTAYAGCGAHEDVYLMLGAMHSLARRFAEDKDA
jgi:hypothetical protein